MKRTARLVFACLFLLVVSPASAAVFDPNGDGPITVADVLYLINHLFAGGPEPVGGGDANGDGSVTVADVLYAINYLFAGGPKPGGPPAITSFAPTSGWVEYTTVAINGTNFDGTTSVTFGGTPASSFLVNDTQIQAKVPADAATGAIAVTNPFGMATSATNFTVNQFPAITSFDPTTGAKFRSVTIDGVGLSGATSVKFGSGSAAFTVVSDVKITTSVASTATTGPITVTTPFGTATSTTFTVIPPPVITSFDPSNGPVGASVTINGTGLSGATSVRLGGVETSFSVNGSTQITAVVPDGVPVSPTTGLRSGTFRVSTPGGNAFSPTSFVVIDRPVITSFTPLSGPVGTSVTISGLGLSRTTGVKFGGVSASFSLLPPSDGDPTTDDTKILATVPAGATSGPIGVGTTYLTIWGTIWSPSSFTVAGFPVPAITSFAPSSGPVGTSVTINGSGLGGATSVTFGGTSASYQVVDFTKITASVPAGATTGSIAATTPGGTATSATSFTVIPAPEITSFAPAKGPVGATVAINVAGLVDPTSVKFGAVPASFTFFPNVTVVTIAATVPPGATSAPITVTTAGGTATSATSFTVERLTAADLLDDVLNLQRSFSIQSWDGMDYPADFNDRGYGGHIQGIARVGGTWVLSHSRTTSSNECGDRGVLIWGTNNNWSFGVSAFDLGCHPGGIQAAGDVVVVPYKHYPETDADGMKFFQVDSTGPHELVHLRLPASGISASYHGESAGLGYHPVHRRYYALDNASQDPQDDAGISSSHVLFRSTKLGAALTDPDNRWEVFAKVKLRASEGASQLMYSEKSQAMFLVALSRPGGDWPPDLQTSRIDVTRLDLDDPTKCKVEDGKKTCDYSGWSFYRDYFDYTLNLLTDPSFRYGGSLLLDEGTGRISVIATERCTSFEFRIDNPINAVPCEPEQNLVEYFILAR